MNIIKSLVLMTFILATVFSCKKAEETQKTGGSITDLKCAEASNVGTLTAGTAAIGVSSSIPYSGGNGGSYSEQTVNSTGVTGLTATLVAGSFNNGSGTLTYTITGTPATSGTANFALNIGGQTCTLSRTVDAANTTGTPHTCGATNVHNPSLSYGTVTDIDGNVYKTIKIGTQEWMAENLKVTKYRNGDPIPNVTDSSAWSNLTSGAWCTYNNNSAYECPYGKLYNWFAVEDSRNICPSGWHVPSDAEWNTFINYLDPNANGGKDNNTAGGKMKTTSLNYWRSPNTGATNESGFSGLPGGGRSINGNYGAIGIDCYWWSSSEVNINTGDAWYRRLTNGGSSILRLDNYSRFGFSVRCLKD